MTARKHTAEAEALVLRVAREYALADSGISVDSNGNARRFAGDKTSEEYVENRAALLLEHAKSLLTAAGLDDMEAAP